MPHHRRHPSLARVRAAALGLALAGCAAAGVAADAEREAAGRDTALAPLIEAVGVVALLDSVRPTLHAELDDDNGCAAWAGPARLAAFSTDALAATLTDTLAGDLDASTLEAVAAWYHGEAGRAVARLEAASADLTEADIADTLGEVVAAPDWDARRGLIRYVLRGTRAGEFLYAFHVELDASVARLRLCDALAEDLDTARTALEQARADRSFYAILLGIELIGPTAAIFAPLDDATLASYADFARSPAGTRWFVALERALQRAFDEARDEIAGPADGNDAAAASDAG